LRAASVNLNTETINVIHTQAHWARCLCAACGLLFNSTTFDAHRVGNYTQRRCLTDEELHALGYRPNGAGFLRIPQDDATRARFQSLKSQDEHNHA
jgi:hypothetical protein